MINLIEAKRMEMGQRISTYLWEGDVHWTTYWDFGKLGICIAHRERGMEWINTVDVGTEEDLVFFERLQREAEQHAQTD